MIENQTEKRAANLLLQRGVKVQVAAPLFFRMFGKKTFSFIIKPPTPRMLLKIADKYLEMEIKSDDMTLNDAFLIYVKHSRKSSEIVALCSSGILHYKIIAWLLRRGITEAQISYLYFLIIAYGGIEDFINTIRLAGATRITKPMNLSPEEKTS